MLRIYCLQQWYGLSDPAAEDALYEITSMRRFAHLSLGRGSIPDESTILLFCHLLEKHTLTEAQFAEINAHLQEKGLLLRQGALVKATIIDSLSSIWPLPMLVTPALRNVKGCQAAWHVAMKWSKRRRLKEEGGELGEANETVEKAKAGIRAYVEHPFRVLKRQFGYQKTRYRGLAKNTVQQHMLFVLENLYMARRELLVS